MWTSLNFICIFCAYYCASACLCFTQYVLIEGAGEVYIHQLAMVQGQAKDLTCKPEVIQMVWVDGGVTVGLKRSSCKTHTVQANKGLYLQSSVFPMTTDQVSDL